MAFQVYNSFLLNVYAIESNFFAKNKAFMLVFLHYIFSFIIFEHRVSFVSKSSFVYSTILHIDWLIKTCIMHLFFF